MYEFVKGTCNDDTFVIQLNSRVYALSDGESKCMFAPDPWSFYKTGLYETTNQKRINHQYLIKAIKGIEDSVNSLNEENEYLYCLGSLKIAAVKQAWDEFNS